MPKYFKSLIVISNSLNEKTVSESIHFLGRKIKIKTENLSNTCPRCNGTGFNGGCDKCGGKGWLNDDHLP